jgi:hypothetical protein
MVMFSASQSAAQQQSSPESTRRYSDRLDAEWLRVSLPHRDDQDARTTMQLDRLCADLAIPLWGGAQLPIERLLDENGVIAEMDRSGRQLAGMDPLRRLNVFLREFVQRELQQDRDIARNIPLPELSVVLRRTSSEDASISEAVEIKIPRSARVASSEGATTHLYSAYEDFEVACGNWQNRQNQEAIAMMRDILADPAAHGLDPRTTLIEAIPVLSMFSLHESKEVENWDLEALCSSLSGFHPLVLSHDGRTKPVAAVRRADIAFDREDAKGIYGQGFKLRITDLAIIDEGYESETTLPTPATTTGPFAAALEARRQDLRAMDCRETMSATQVAEALVASLNIHRGRTNALAAAIVEETPSLLTATQSDSAVMRQALYTSLMAALAGSVEVAAQRSGAPFGRAINQIGPSLADGEKFNFHRLGDIVRGGPRSSEFEGFIRGLSPGRDIANIRAHVDTLARPRGPLSLTPEPDLSFEPKPAYAMAVYGLFGSNPFKQITEDMRRNLRKAKDTVTATARRFSPEHAQRNHLFNTAIALGFEVGKQMEAGEIDPKEAIAMCCEACGLDMEASPDIAPRAG